MTIPRTSDWSAVEVYASDSDADSDGPSATEIGSGKIARDDEYLSITLHLRGEASSSYVYLSNRYVRADIAPEQDQGAAVKF
jgi:hypothetical protein